MTTSLEQFLEQVARRGSWVGGGSAAALSAALAAALLEKLLLASRTRAQLRRIRRECVALIDRDATAFARVIEATRRHRPQVFRETLKRATDIPCRIVEYSRLMQTMGRVAQRQVKPKFQSDLRCAVALARASDEAATALIETNLVWLNDRAYAAALRRRLSAVR